MSKTSIPNAVKTKPSLPTTKLFVKNGGELFISREKHKELNRVVSSKQYSDGTDLTLLMVFGDTYRMRSKRAPDYGHNFVSPNEVQSTTHAVVTVHNTLNETKQVTATGFAPVSFNKTIMGDIYNRIINELTLGRHLINVSVTDNFSIRDMSKSPTSYLGQGMLLYQVKFINILNIGLDIKECKPLTVKEAEELLSKEIEPDTFYIRQDIREGKSIQVVFQPELQEIFHDHLIEMLKFKVPEALFELRGNRWLISPNFEYMGI